MPGQKEFDSVSGRFSGLFGASEGEGLVEFPQTPFLATTAKTDDVHSPGDRSAIAPTTAVEPPPVVRN